MAAIKSRAADPRRRVIIYAWVCPDTSTPVYVGKTAQTLSLRQSAHRNEARRHPSTPKHHWLRALWDAGKDVRIVELEHCTVEASAFVECEWIRLLSERFELLNVAIGGCGNPGVGRVEWTDDVIALLGKVSDADLAKRLGCNQGTVCYRRKVLGIPKCKEKVLPPSTITLPPDIIGRLGHEPDYVLAKKVGVSKFVIAKHRKRLGILPCAVVTGQDGKVKPGDQRRLKAIPQEVMDCLGKMTDEEFSKIAGVTKGGAAQMRYRLGIPSYALTRDKTIRQRRWAPRRRQKNAGYRAGNSTQAELPL